MIPDASRTAEKSVWMVSFMENACPLSVLSPDLWRNKDEEED